MGWRSQIGDALVLAIGQVTTANGYTQTLRTVEFDKIKVKISDFKDFELPAVQIYDTLGEFNHQMSRSKTSWFLTVEIVLRSTELLGTVSQRTLWDLSEDVVRAIMVKANLGLGWVQHCKMIDSMTDLHLQVPNYTATIGLEIMFYEPMTRDVC